MMELHYVQLVNPAVVCSMMTDPKMSSYVTHVIIRHALSHFFAFVSKGLLFYFLLFLRVVL